MQIFRKFYDVAAPETPSIASIMASKGVLSQPNDSGAKAPETTTEKVEEKPQPEATPPAATASETPIAEKDTSVSPEKSEESKPEPVKKDEPVKIPSWQEVLKQQQPDAILKELGFDDETTAYLSGRKGIEKKLINFLKHWESNGNVDRYLQEANTNYDNLSAEAIMRLQLRRDYPKATEKQLDILFKKEVLESYRLTDSFSDEEAEEGRELLAVKADKLREQFKSEQENYLMPKVPEKKDEVEDTQAADRQLFDSYKNTIDSLPIVQKLLTNNTYTVGEGEEAFNLTLSNTQEAVDSLLNNIASGIVLGNVTKNDLTGLNEEYIKNHVLAYEFAKNPSAFIKKIGEHFITLGGKKVMEPIENATPPANGSAAKAEETPASPAAAMAKSGRINRGGS